MGKGTDLARQIIEMNREYNKHVQTLYRTIDELRDEIRYQKDKAESQKDYFNKKIEENEKTLETVTDIICHNINSTRAGEHYINLWEDQVGFKSLIAALGITIEVSKTEREEKENEN